MIHLVMAGSIAHASWFIHWCERLNIIAEDPYQYEQADRAWVEREIDRITIKQTWKCATEQDVRTLKVLEFEMSRPHRCAEGLGSL